MTIQQLLKDKIFDLPLTSAEYFPDHISNTLKKYIGLLEKVDDQYSKMISGKMADILETCKDIQSIIHEIFKGNSVRSSYIFSELMQRISQDLVPKNRNNQIADRYSHLFKSRIGNGMQFTSADMFHIPFELRYNVPSNRFSVPGTPCLYLSNSIYTCWEELGRPPFGEMYVSRYEQTGLRFIHLDIIGHIEFCRNVLTKYEHQKSLLETANNLLPKILRGYPLYMACYCKVFSYSRSFRPEYVFPQLLMQWIISNDEFDGIAYNSTRCPPYKIENLNLKSFTNFAVPTKTVKKRGYCNVLKDKLKITDPVSWDILKMIQPYETSKRVDWDEDVRNRFPVPPILNLKFEGYDRPIPYWQTAFGRLESELIKKTPKRLK